MFPEIVVVALPEETSAPDSEAVLAACSQAYLDGECQSPSEGMEHAHLIAEVRWLSETRAEVSVRFVGEEGERAAQRSLEFQPGDAAAERYRTLGFAAGSLAGTLSELERIDAEAKSAESRAEPDAATATEPEIAPLKPPVAIDPGRVKGFSDDYRFGVQLASGIDAARMGMALGVRGVWSERWLLELQGGYSTQSSNTDGIEGTFVNVCIGLGVQARTGPLVLDTSVGPSLQWRRAERSAVTASDSELSPGAELALSARYAGATVSPFLEMRAGLYRATDVLIAEDEQRSLGPLQLQGVLGFVITRGGD